MSSSADRTIRRSDYSPPAYRVETIDLIFVLHEETTQVTATLHVQRNDPDKTLPLILFGQELELLGLSCDDRELLPGDYFLDAEKLILPAPPDDFVLKIVTAIHPAQNTALEGLYLSNGRLCTQCEAEGFRRITFFPDRPDILAQYAVTLIAAPGHFPVLLSNGNLIESGTLDDGRHFARWVDPFPKPSYLFALVAGDLALLRDTFVTGSGRTIDLRIYVEASDLGKCGHAMQSLKEAMRWDEEVYGLEYDLDIYMIVAVHDFNMGAMENKGLNVFNARYVLASPETATDADFQAIREVIGHEYFHNWTGNRVTCRDWFQLSLKEGLTVFRDQQFSADLGSRAVKRIQDVRTLRATQFAEDSGPMAHPVRPESYEEINNFYTATVYNKGAEVIGMYRTLLGEATFIAGVRLYLARHDGQAATIDDFLQAMEETSGRVLSQFSRWYSEAGTPTVTVTRDCDENGVLRSLTMRQRLTPTVLQPRKEFLHIPFALGIVGPDGRDLPVRLVGEARRPADTRIIELRNGEETFHFAELPPGAVPSLLRGFSAPIRVHDDLCDSERAFLLAHDSDPFCRWEAGQQLFTDLILKHAAEPVADKRQIPTTHAAAFRSVLCDADSDPALRALALSLPSVATLIELRTPSDPVALHTARSGVRASLAAPLAAELRTLYNALSERAPYTFDGSAVGRRSLKSIVLSLLASVEPKIAASLCQELFENADNMTDRLTSLTILADAALPGRENALAAFHQRWHDEPLVLDKWFTLQAIAGHDDVFNEVVRLRDRPDFNLLNPNRVRSLLNAFAYSNPGRFHRQDGQGYDFIASEVIALDRLNPQISARLAASLSRWRSLAEPYATGMRLALERIAACAPLSRDLHEVISKSLKETP